MMNTHAVHKALSYLEHQATWPSDDESPWSVVGDGIKFDPLKLQTLIDAWLKSERVLVSVDRKTAFDVPREELTEALNSGSGYIGHSFGRILITDFNMTAIVELKDMGVARCGIVNENARSLELLGNDRS